MDLFKKTFDLFDQTMKQFGKDLKEAMDKMEKVLNEKTSAGTTVRIKKGSKVIINGAVVTLMEDTLVTTTDPDTLMGK